MGKKDARIDLYIARSAGFARPILNHLRELVHRACPETEEKMKWSFPHFDYKGMMCSMAAFNQHCAFGFWKTALMEDAKKMLGNRTSAMGSLGRITSLKDLPSDKIITGYIKEAMKLNDDQIKITRPKQTEKKELVIPKYFSDAIKNNKKASLTFDGFSHSNKKDYVDWITEAKTEMTRIKRLDQAVEWIAEGKIRNWKYLKK